MVGYAAGTLAGVASRGLATRASDRASQEVAERANALLIETPRGDWPSRAAKVNQFWGEGQSVPLRGGPEVPFTANPGSATPFKANPNAPSSAELYLPSRTSNVATDAGIAGVYGAESLYAQEVMGPQARAELAEARAA
jgi:hypothetical protein